MESNTSVVSARGLVVAALTLQHNVAVRDEHQLASPSIIGASSVGDRVTHLVFLLSARDPGSDHRRPHDVPAAAGPARRLPRHSARACPVRGPGGHVHQASPPALTLLAVIPGTLIVVAVLTAIPARIGAGRPVADVLRSE
jgi:hypothetical protein